MTIHETILAVMADVGAIGKNQKNTHQRYNFRGIDDVMDAFHGPMVKHGLFVVPEVKSAEYREIQTAKSVQTAAVLRVKFTFWNREGEHLSMVTQGEGRDTSDKATNKALAAALKYAMLQAFMVPIDGAEDADATTPEPEIVRRSGAVLESGIKVTIDDIVESVKPTPAQFTAEAKIAAMEAVGGDKAKAQALWNAVVTPLGLDEVTTPDERDAVIAALKAMVLPFEEAPQDDEEASQ